jgi:hypothetical protein
MASESEDFSSWQVNWAPYYPNFVAQAGNPELTPEHQQGTEGGLELYLGSRGSLVVTRYNQTVDRLISSVIVDSVDYLPEIRAQYGLAPWEPNAAQYQRLNLNIGTIRNQGWELQGNMNLGPFVTRGTYSWTKSRTIGVNPKYRSQFPALWYPQFQPGATFQFLPEHTWALGVTYAREATTVGLSVSGTGQARNEGDAFSYRYLLSSVRLPQNRLNVSAPYGSYISHNRGYAMADMTASHRFASRMEGVLQVLNLNDFYINDLSAGGAVIGRQFKVGLRLRTQ